MSPSSLHPYAGMRNAEGIRHYQSRQCGNALPTELSKKFGIKITALPTELSKKYGIKYTTLPFELLNEGFVSLILKFASFRTFLILNAGQNLTSLVLKTLLSTPAV